MRPPIFVHTYAFKAGATQGSGGRRVALLRCLRAASRWQILLASARREHPPRRAENLGCGSQTVRNAIHDFNERGLGALQAGSSRPKEVHAAFDEQSARSLRELLHRSPREFGRQSSLWTLADAAEVSFEEGLTNQQVSGETIRATLSRLGLRWERAKRWIESPDPEYARKKGLEIG
jgi:transposase